MAYKKKLNMGNQELPQAKLTQTEIENLRDYHQLQYERIDKLEEQRFNFANLILTISVGALAFGYENATMQDSNPVQLYLIPVMLIFGNLTAIFFVSKSRKFIKMHQKRAEAARRLFAPIFNKINDEVGKIDSDKDLLRRERLYIYLHVIFMVIASTIFIYGLVH